MSAAGGTRGASIVPGIGGPPFTKGACCERMKLAEAVAAHIACKRLDLIFWNASAARDVRRGRRTEHAGACDPCNHAHIHRVIEVGVYGRDGGELVQADVVDLALDLIDFWRDLRIRLAGPTEEAVDQELRVAIVEQERCHAVPCDRQPRLFRGGWRIGEAQGACWRVRRGCRDRACAKDACDQGRHDFHAWGRFSRPLGWRAAQTPLPAGPRRSAPFPSLDRRKRANSAIRGHGWCHRAQHDA